MGTETEVAIETVPPAPAAKLCNLTVTSVAAPIPDATRELIFNTFPLEVCGW